MHVSDVRSQPKRRKYHALVISRGLQLTKLLCCAPKTPKPKKAHMPTQVTIIHPAWKIHLPKSGINADPRGYKTTKTMAMPRP